MQNVGTTTERDSGTVVKTGADEIKYIDRDVYDEFEDVEFTQEHVRDSAGNERTQTTFKGFRRKKGAKTNAGIHGHSEEERAVYGSSRDEQNAEFYKSSDLNDNSPAPVVSERDYGFVRWIIAGLVIVAIIIIIVIYRKEIKKWLQKRQ